MPKTEMVKMVKETRISYLALRPGMEISTIVSIFVFRKSNKGKFANLLHHLHHVAIAPNFFTFLPLRVMAPFTPLRTRMPRGGLCLLANGRQ